MLVLSQNPATGSRRAGSAKGDNTIVTQQRTTGGNATMELKAIATKGEDGRYFGKFPQYPGCVSEGDTVEELAENLTEAITGWIEIENEEVEAAMPEGGIIVSVEV